MTRPTIPEINANAGGTIETRLKLIMIISKAVKESGVTGIAAKLERAGFVRNSPNSTPLVVELTKGDSNNEDKGEKKKLSLALGEKDTLHFLYTDNDPVMLGGWVNFFSPPVPAADLPDLIRLCLEMGDSSCLTIRD